MCYIFFLVLMTYIKTRLSSQQHAFLISCNNRISKWLYKSSVKCGMTVLTTGFDMYMHVHGDMFLHIHSSRVLI